MFLGPRLKYCLWTFCNFVTDVSIDGSLYNILYTTIVILGIIVHPFFFSFLLLDIVRISQSLQTLLVTILLIAKTLFLITFLIVAFIWIFSIYVFLFIPGQFSPDDGQYCDFPLQCMLSLSHIGMSTAGVPLEFMAPGVWSETGTFIGFVIFNIAFYMVVGMILYNIIFATIVDQFGQLRDARAHFATDLANRCFICSVEREVFQRKISERDPNRHGASNKVFMDHVTFDHRAWDYLFYFQYLKMKKDPMTSNEEHVLSSIHTGQYLYFFPVGRAKILEQNDEDQKETAERQMEALSKEVKTLRKMNARLLAKVDSVLDSMGKSKVEERPLSSRSDSMWTQRSMSFQADDSPTKEEDHGSFRRSHRRNVSVSFSNELTESPTPLSTSGGSSHTSHHREYSDSAQHHRRTSSNPFDSSNNQK